MKLNLYHKLLPGKLKMKRMKDNLLEYSSCNFLNDVSTWYSSVTLYRDHKRFSGCYIAGLMLGNGLMLAVEVMSSEIPL